MSIKCIFGLQYCQLTMGLSRHNPIVNGGRSVMYWDLMWFGLSWNHCAYLSTTICHFSTFSTFLRAASNNIHLRLSFFYFLFWMAQSVYVCRPTGKFYSFTVSVRTWVFPFILLCWIFILLSSVSSYSFSIFSDWVKLPFMLFFPIIYVKMSFFFHPTITIL